MRKINRKARKRVFTLIFLFVFLVSSQFLIFSNPVSATIQEEDISVEWGDNVYQNLPYWYSGTFYDDTNFEFAWTTAKIQFEYIPDSSVTYEHSITDLDNSEIEYPSNSSFTMVDGIHYKNGSLIAVDGDYHIFNSTYEKSIVEQPADFTIANGSSTYTGDLEFLDGDYTTFYSEELPEAGHYIANYTFTDDADGSNPAWWTTTEPAGVTIEVVGEKSDHKKVVRILHDGSAVNGYFEQNVASQTSGTYEYWMYTVDASDFIIMQLRDAGSQTIKMAIQSDNWQYYSGGWLTVPNVAVPTDNTWHHVKVNFECSDSGYMGLGQYNFEFIVDGVSSGVLPFLANDDEINRVQFWAYSGNAVDCYLDAIDYSWNENYIFGDNWYYNNYLGNQTFEEYNTTNYDYYGSYSFNEDPDGTAGVAIGFIDVDNTGAGCTTTIATSIDGHKKVLDMYDNGNPGIADISHNIADEAYGTIEYWIRITDANRGIDLRLQDGGISLLEFRLKTYKFLYWDGIWNDVGAVALDNTWYHIRIDFECTAEGYEGLAQYDWHVYINGVQYGDYDFGNNQAHTDELQLLTAAIATAYNVYFDAFGFSWLSNYTIGDNFNPCGTLPELQTDGWGFDFAYNTSVRITGEDTSHKKILELYDNSGTYSVGANYNFPNQATGTYEFWVYTTDSTKETHIISYEDATNEECVQLKIDLGKLQYYSGGYIDITDGAISNDVWYHFRIDFDCSTYTFDIYINGDLKDTDLPFRDNRNSMKNIRFQTGASDSGYYSYLDSLSFDWDDGYTIGDNQYINDPLDLNIEVNMNLDSFSNLNELYLVYAYLTDISLTCNYSIYNFDDSDYDVIENDINLVFINSYFLLNSSYYNATNDIILSFVMSNLTSEFEMRLDRLLVRKPSYLNFSTTVNFDVIINLLKMDINSYQRCDISQLINMSIWSYGASSWTYLNGSSFITTFQLLQWINSTFSNYINSNGDISLNYYGVNITDTFRFELDALNFTLYRKTIVRHQKTLSLLGTWKYRFVLDAGLGTQHIVDWIYFNVIQQQPNFEGISESRYSTQWVLTSTATTGDKNIVYEDQLTSGYWDLTDTASNNFWGDYDIDQDSWVNNRHIPDYRDTNYGSETNLQSYCGVYEISWRWYRKVYLSFNTIDEVYFDLNTTWNPNNLLYLYAYQVRRDSTRPWVFLYSTTTFDEDTITWNNKPAIVDLIDSQDTVAGNMYFDLGSTSLEGRYLELHQDETSAWCYAYFYSREYSSLNPKIYVSYVKNYHDTTGEGYAYFQSDTTETLGLISPQYSSKSLSVGDIFTVDLQTTSDNALLKLYSGGVLQQTLNLLIGNTKTTRQTVEVLVSEDVSFDRVKITSELTDTEYFKLYDVKAEHWVFEDEEDQRSMFVNPFGQNDLIANLGNNSLKIYENDILRTDTYVTISYDLLTHIFESTIPETVFVSFYDSNSEYLDFNEFTTYVNYTLYEEDYIDQRLTSREFYVDEGSTIYFNVYDSFDVSIYSASRLAKTFIDITLGVYSLKIKNEALDDASYTLTKGIISKEGILFPDDIDEYQIASGNYTFSYIKGSDSEVSVNFDLTQNRLLKINRSRMCYLTYSNQRGEHLFFENYKTYLNGSLIYENIFYRDIGDIVGIEIKDRYGISIKNETYTVVAGDNYIPITLTMYSLKIMNQQEIFNWINITRDPNYYESSMYWSEWIAPNEIIEFTLFAGYYKINLTDNENSGSSYYSYTLNGDDVLLISSGNTLSNLIINIANVNTTIGNQITNVQIDLTNQNSNINNTIINIEINLSNVNSTLGNLLTNINLDIININNNISNLYTFTENNFLNLGNNINNSFISITNNIIAINQTISTLVIGLDGKVTIVNATITTMFTEMNSQFIVVQSTLDFSFAFLNQTIVQIGNNITNNQIALNNLIIQRANDIDNSIIQIQTLINLLNSTVANESLVVQTLVNIIGSNITENHIIINNLINLLGNNITENNINLVSLIELVGNNITTNHFVIQTLIDYVSNNITDNHLEFLTNINLINNTIGQNQIELINRLLFINNSINEMALDLTNQIILVNNTIYSAILDVSVSIDFNSDNILGNISLTYQQNDFLTNLYRTTMFSQLLNWSGVAYNYSLIEDRIDVWEFINNYRNDSITVFLRYNDLIDNLTISAQNTIDQFLPNENVEYRLWSISTEEYLSDWEALPDNRTVSFGFYEEEIPDIPDFNAPGIWLMIILILMGCGFAITFIGYIAYRYRKKSESYRRSYADKITLEAQTIKKFSRGTRVR